MPRRSPLRPRFSRLVRLACLIAGLIALAQPVRAQTDLAAALLARINQLRVQSGLLPLAANSPLTAAAQRLASDMAVTGRVDHIGSDGSTMDGRIRATGFGYWRGFGIWAENIYGGPAATLDAAWNYWIATPGYRANLLSTHYREVGWAVVTSDQGTFFVINFGSQPNVLPFFVTGDPPVVTLLLTNENDITTGEGVAVMGQATEVRIAEGTDTRNAGWLPWAPSIPFRLAGTGTRTITVEYRDELGRGTKSTRTIEVPDLAASTNTPTRTTTSTRTSTPRATNTATPTPRTSVTPRATNTATPTVTSTPRPTNTATPTPRTSATPRATNTATPTVTWTPHPTNTTTPTSTPTVTSTPRPTSAATATPTATPHISSTPVIATSSATVTPSATPSPTVTPILAQPTSTIALSASPTTTPAAPTATVVALIFPTSVSASRLTPPAPRPKITDKPLFASLDAAPGDVLLAICGLQIMAVALIALAWLLRALARRKA